MTITYSAGHVKHLELLGVENGLGSIYRLTPLGPIYTRTLTKETTSAVLCSAV